MLELDEHLERKPANLSGGQRQRVAMGRAIVRQADAFLFDEPLSNLDAKLRGQMRTEIARMQRRLGITTVYVTHDQTEAMTLGDRVAVLQQGDRCSRCASPARALRAAGQPVRRRLHRLAADELPAGEGRRDDAARLPFVDVPMTADLAAKVTGLDLVHRRRAARSTSRTRRSVDAASSGGPRRSPRPVDVTEWLGNEQYAYIPFEADPSRQGQAGRARPRAGR